LKETIESILNQTFRDFEFLIIDDGSTDQTEEIISSFIDERIHFVKNNENLKIISTLNKGLSLARGKYIARMDSDDICALNRLERQVEFLENNPSVGLVGSDYKSFGTINSSIHYASQYEDLKFAALFYNPFCHPSIMMRKEILSKFSLSYNPDFLHVEDYKLWTEFLIYTDCQNLSEELISYRTHANQISKVHEELQKSNVFKVQKDYLKNAGFNLSNEEVQDLTLSLILTSIYLTSVEKLILQNKQLRFFDQNIVLNYFSKTIKNWVLESSKIEKTLFSQLKKSEIYQSISWTFKQKISIRLKLR
jgi:glycosyltransferase involved in cell wall biosynthesis